MGGVLNEPARVLLVDDDARALDWMRGVLAPRFVCESVASGEAGLSAFGELPFDVVLSSSELRGGVSALELLEGVHLQSPRTRFILIGRDPPIESVVEACRRGATDYLVRPLAEGALAESVDRAVHEIHDRALGLSGEHRAVAAPRTTIIGSSPALLAALGAVDRVALSSAPVLLVGETGTGRTLFAGTIHARSPRRHRPFVVVNAAATPASGLDAELFGQVGGGAPGRSGRARRGLFAEAESGTLFVDEVADLPLDIQGRLLRLLESGAIRAVGADQERPVDVRLIAATQRDLLEGVRRRAFREDLFYRLSALAIELPPLRERPDDMPALIDYVFENARARNPRSPVKELTLAARERLQDRSWPGNVRELEGVIERLVVFGASSHIDASDVAAAASPPGRVDTAPVASSGAHDLASLRDMSIRYVESVLASTNGDKARAAAILGIDVSTLYRWQRRKRSS